MLKQYLTAKYFFYINPILLDRSDKAFFAAGAVLVLLGAVFKLAAVLSPTPVDKKYRNKFFNLFITIGIAEVVWFGARAQDVMFFGSHFVALLALLIGLIWGVWLLVFIIKNYRREKVAYEKEQVRMKYLPNSSK